MTLCDWAGVTTRGHQRALKQQPFIELQKTKDKTKSRLIFKSFHKVGTKLHGKTFFGSYDSVKSLNRST